MKMKWPGLAINTSNISITVEDLTFGYSELTAIDVAIWSEIKLLLNESL